MPLALWPQSASPLAAAHFPMDDSLGRIRVKTVHMILEEELVTAVDGAAKRLGTTRSGFARRALRQALAHLRAQEPERKHRLGYERHPVKPDEFGLWEPEQIWPA